MESGEEVKEGIRYINKVREVQENGRGRQQERAMETW